MKRIIITVTFFVALIYTPASAAIINIPDDYTTIQAGINASSDGDTVLVQPEIYYENINFNGHNIVLGSLFLTTGDTSYISSTIIDGSSSGSVIAIGSGEDSTTTVTGFTIQNGDALFHGGGVYCYNSNPAIISNIIRENTVRGLFVENGKGAGISCINSNSLITNNTICENTALGDFLYSGGFGGGIYVGNSDAMIVNNTIVDNYTDAYGGGILCGTYSASIVSDNIIDGNSARAGGGIYSQSSSSTIINNTISNNSSDYGGGGIFCLYTEITIINNTIRDNTAGSGGGICCSAASPAISNNTITGNSAGSGGGVSCTYSSSAIINNTISGNLAQVGGGLCCSASNPEIKNTIFWANEAQTASEIFVDTGSSAIIVYNDIQDTLWPGEGNIDADPLFVDPENGDYHLQAGSPCIDAGDPDSPYDPDSTIADIGAFYFDQMVGIDDVDMLPIAYQLSFNYPNPFNAATTISYDLPQPGMVTLDIYDILGRKVQTLYNDNQPAGSHSLIWNADGFSSGVYFYKLTAGEYKQTQKMMLLK